MRYFLITVTVVIGVLLCNSSDAFTRDCHSEFYNPGFNGANNLDWERSIRTWQRQQLDSFNSSRSYHDNRQLQDSLDRDTYNRNLDNYLRSLNHD